MDFAQLDTCKLADDGVQHHIVGPDGAPLYTDDKPVTLTLLGADSAKLTAISNQHANAILRNRNQMQVTAELAMTNEIKRLAAATVGWDGIVLEGEPLPFSEDNAAMLYRRFPWLRDQVRTFIDDRANFLNASPKS
ncbi:hypothetical protein [uncultured Brevundimonas sp.]|uniref:hypothetical protein n=1 Tax=uncultured Brevundimonas sp. TaxID=213418 RepID=UPI00262799C1|nr:hypothetical protein [uncultured Brevundimonas sp.]